MRGLATILKAAGIKVVNEQADELWACCPMPEHTEKTPSWSINCTTSKWYCFGCGIGGDLVKLIEMKLELGFREAMKWLSEYEESEKLPTKISVVVRKTHGIKFQMPPGVSSKDFEEWPSGIREYVVGRGITPAQVAKWGLSYSMVGRLNGRVVIPIADRNKLLSYTARSWIRGLEPRYKTPNENPRRGRVEGSDRGAVFGEKHWPNAVSDETVVVGEGEINGLVFDRLGCYFGSLGGSSTTMIQLLKLGAFGRIVIAKDQDTAGNKITRQLLGAFGRKAKVLEFQKGMDAASVGDKETKRLLWECTRT